MNPGHEREKSSFKIGFIVKSKKNVKDFGGNVHLDIITVKVITKKDRTISGLSTSGDFRLMKKCNRGFVNLNHAISLKRR